MGRLGIGINWRNPNTVYALVTAQRGQGGFFRSDDACASWTRIGRTVRDGGGGGGGFGRQGGGPPAPPPRRMHTARRGGAHPAGGSLRRRTRRWTRRSVRRLLSW